jgi:O-antigen biosynthesis protein
MEDERVVSVVIPQRGQVEMTLNCVGDLRAHESAELEVIVVDDGTEGNWSRERSALEGLGVRVVSQPATGVTAAWNRGWNAARGRTVVFLNNDVRVAGPFVERLCEPVSAHCALVSGVEWRWEGTVPSVAAPVEPSNGAIRGWMCLAGYCFAVRRDWLERRGGFDARMRLYWSDTDLQWEARQSAGAGALVRVETAGGGRHLGHRTAHRMADRHSVWREDRRVFVEKWKGESVLAEPLIRRAGAFSPTVERSP